MVDVKCNGDDCPTDFKLLRGNDIRLAGYIKSDFRIRSQMEKYWEGAIRSGKEHEFYI